MKNTMNQIPENTAYYRESKRVPQIIKPDDPTLYVTFLQLLVSVSVKWDYSIPYGLLYSFDTPEDVLQFVEAVRTLCARHNIPSFGES